MKQDKKKDIIVNVILIIVTILIGLTILGVTYWYIYQKNNAQEEIIEPTIKDIEEIQNNAEEIIEDKEPPIIIGVTDKEINLGTSIDLLEGIEVSDNIDKELELSSEGHVDINKPGEYSIKIIAKDDSGNISEKTFKVTVKDIIQDNNEVIPQPENNNNYGSTKPSAPSTPQTPNAPTVPSAPEAPNTPTTPSTPPILTGTETVTEVTNTQVKYGVQIKTYTTTVYNVYGDGSREVKSTSNRTEYDRTNYSATTSELIAEAKSAKSKYSSMINQVISNTNTYRAEANEQAVEGITNRGSLTLDNDLCVAACVRAVEMAYSTKFDHTRPNGSSCFTVVKEMGISYRSVGENIAKGQTSAASVSKSWRNSAGHYSNMITSDFTKIGVGVFKLDGEFYWVQLFT